MNKEGTKHKCPLRAPVSIEHLLALRHALNLSTPFHAAVWALALCTFFGCQRLGELAVTTAQYFTVPHLFLQESSHSSGIPLESSRNPVIPVEFHWNPQEFTGIPQEFHWNQAD